MCELIRKGGALSRGYQNSKHWVERADQRSGVLHTLVVRVTNTIVWEEKEVAGWAAGQLHWWASQITTYWQAGQG